MDSHYLTASAADNAALENLLVKGITSASSSISASRCSADTQILDLACGNCRETEPLINGVRKSFLLTGSCVRFVGADIRGSHIAEAKQRAASLKSLDFQAEFLLQDCSKLEQHNALGEDFSIVFLRHQNVWNDPAVWTRIFAEGLRRLADEGLLVITSYFDREHRLAIKAIEGAGGELVTSVRNSHARALRTPGKSVDRHLAVFRRKLTSRTEPEISPGLSLL